MINHIIILKIEESNVFKLSSILNFYKKNNLFLSYQINS